MRTLSVKQKKALDKIIMKNKPRKTIYLDDLTEWEYWDVYNLNRHECFDSNVERYLYDKHTKETLTKAGALGR